MLTFVLYFFYWKKGTRTHQPIGASWFADDRGLTPPLVLATRILPPQAWGRVAQVPKTTTTGLASRTWQSDRVKGIFHSGPLKSGPPIHIDLTEQDLASDVGTATRGGLATRGAGTSRAVVAIDSASKMKGKRVVTTIEKGIEIMEAKKRRMKPDWKH
jgi:hypothetical protein